MLIPQMAMGDVPPDSFDMIRGLTSPARQEVNWTKVKRPAGRAIRHPRHRPYYARASVVCAPGTGAFFHTSAGRLHEEVEHVSLETHVEVIQSRYQCSHA